ncbi:MAG: VanZ family protein, partial [Clostridia bacterium]|nr:VanZ family protein [Clostridia bacterium]
CVLFAVSDEIHQIFVPGRAFEISDIVTDSAGVLIGCLLIFIFRRKLIRQ